MSGECDNCDEHCLECECNAENKESIDLEKSLIDINDVQFSVRTENFLRSHRIKYLNDLTQLTTRTLLDWQGMGKKSLNEVREKLAFYGLSLKDEIKEIMSDCDKCGEHALDCKCTKKSKRIKRFEKAGLIGCFNSSTTICLDFSPDVIIFFYKVKNGVGRQEIWGGDAWGDEQFYQNIKEYLENLIKDFDKGWLFIQKGTLKYKIFDGFIGD